MSEGLPLNGTRWFSCMYVGRAYNPYDMVTKKNAHDKHSLIISRHVPDLRRRPGRGRRAGRALVDDVRADEVLGALQQVRAAVHEAVVEDERAPGQRGYLHAARRRDLVAIGLGLP